MTNKSFWTEVGRYLFFVVFFLGLCAFVYFIRQLTLI